MTEAEICKLCKDNRAIDIDLEKPQFKSVNKLLQILFDWYKIDAAILGENSCICERCFGETLRISESLEKWGTVHEEFHHRPIEIDDSTAFQVNLEVPSDKEEVETEMNDEENSLDQHIAEPLKEDHDPLAKNENMEIVLEESLKTPSEDYFCVGLARNGLAVTKFFKDKTQSTRMLCTCCGDVLEILSQIRMHSWKRRPNPVYYCRECGSEFRKIRELLEHMKTMEHNETMSSGRDLEFLCLRCNQIFPRYFDVIRHEKMVHNLSDFICEECNVHFANKGSYRRHMRGHEVESKQNRFYECPYKNCTSRYSVSQLSCHCLFAGLKSKVPPAQQERLLRRGKFMTLDPKERVEPDRKARYRGNNFNTKADFPEDPTECTNGGQFISLPKKMSLQKGKYINVSDN
ncbi:histone-lysine N-methyltransferase PRDM9 [Drosophila simulans]|uniref:C2H2-type domain-containing protein n=1 Tax=Drosophila simulans TaxID=7240 RepID=A0A0J9RW70_DROSI|nr:histone-lysine N-methyltransferase PRDM9 [Drosophila simulans]KMY99827.1 uncharacterized protein Dsimw501_GD14574 [Drosophila simulans]